MSRSTEASGPTPGHKIWIALAVLALIATVAVILRPQPAGEATPAEAVLAASTHWDQRDLTRARGSLERASEPDSRLAWAWFLQELYEGRYREALDRLADEPMQVLGQPYVYYPRALLQAELHVLLDETADARLRFDDARETLERELNRRPEDARLHGALGIVYAGLGRRDDAVYEVQHSIELSPSDVDSIKYRNAELIQVLVKIGDRDAALDWLEDGDYRSIGFTSGALSMDPRLASLHALPRFRRAVVKAS